MQQKIHTADRRGNLLVPQLIEELNAANGTKYGSAIAIVDGMIWHVPRADPNSAKNLGHVDDHKPHSDLGGLLESCGLVIANPEDLELFQKRHSGYSYQPLHYAQD